MFEILGVADVGGEDFDNVLLVDDRSAQDSCDGGDGVRPVFSLGEDVIDFPRPKGRMDGRERDDEPRGVERILFDGGIEEDRVREERLGVCSGGVVEGEDQDPLPGGNREGG